MVIFQAIWLFMQLYEAEKSRMDDRPIIQIPPSPPENQRKTFVFALVFSIPGISYYICSNLHSCDRNRDHMRHLYFLNSSSIPALARRYTLSFSDACAYMSIVNAAVACPSIACTIFCPHRSLSPRSRQYAEDHAALRMGGRFLRLCA